MKQFKNIGLTAVLVLNGLFIPSLHAQDVAQVAPQVYKLLSDTLGVRVFEVTFKPGSKAELHTHPDHAVYVLEGGSLEIADAKGMKTTIEVKPGMSLILEGESHSAVNPGKTTVRAIVTEIWRPRK